MTAPDSTVSTVKVLFVCLGNICRSPSAEGVFRKYVVDAGLESRFEIDSAGTLDYHAGERADRRSERAAQRRGIDISKHRARQIEPHDFERYDYILAMDKSNLSNLERLCPAAHRHKLALMMSFAPALGDEVPDPYYGDGTAFENVLDMLEDACRNFLTHIVEKQLLASLKA